MEAPHTLLTFSGCAHFAIFGNEITTFEALDLLGDLAQQAQDALSVLPLHTHSVHPGICPGCTKATEKTPVKQIETAKDANIYLRDLLVGSIQRHKALGAAYHSLEFAKRAKTADIPEAALAHQQFAIKEDDIGDDAWFAPIMEVAEAILGVEKLLNGTDASTKLSEAITSINQARFLYGSAVIVHLNELADSCQVVQAERPYKHRSDELHDEGDDELPSRTYVASLDMLTRWIEQSHDTLAEVDK